MIKICCVKLVLIDRDWKELSIGGQFVDFDENLNPNGEILAAGCKAGFRAAGDFLAPFLAWSI